MRTTIGWINAAVEGRRATTADSDPQKIGTSRRRAVGDVGEGVISVAIAVLIMAFLGAAMWVGFQKMWKTTEANTNQKVEQIGSQ